MTDDQKGQNFRDDVVKDLGWIKANWPWLKWALGCAAAVLLLAWFL